MADHQDAEVVELPMVCTCDPGRAAAAADSMVRVRARLGPRRPVTAENFLTEVCRSLRWDLQAHVDLLLLDQWFVVGIEQLVDPDHERLIRVQADEAEHGLAALWDYLDAERDSQRS